MSELLTGAFLGLAVWMALNSVVTALLRGRTVTYTLRMAVAFALFAIVLLTAGVVIR